MNPPPNHDELTPAHVRALIAVCCHDAKKPRTVQLADEAAAIIENRSQLMRIARFILDGNPHNDPTYKAN